MLDLFSGCGGFSLGAHAAGFNVVGALDNDPILASSYPHNFPGTQMMLKDVTDVAGKAVRAAVGGRIDGIIGGPPCQGFSAIGRRDPKDPRRWLLGHFFRIVREVRPVFFVMENVTGLGYSHARSVLDDALHETKGYGILGPQVWDAADFGAATNRRRLFVIGVREDCGEILTLEDVDAFKRKPATVRAAISDLEDAEPVGEQDGFDVWRITRSGRPSDYDRRLRA